MPSCAAKPVAVWGCGQAWIWAQETVRESWHLPKPRSLRAPGSHWKPGTGPHGDPSGDSQ